MTGTSDRLWTVVRRELRGAVRTRLYVFLGLALTGIAFGVARTGGGPAGGYVPTVVDILLVVEVLVPTVAFAVGYRAIVDDAVRGELDVLQTYPLPTWAYVAGVYVGRAIALLAVTLVPLALLGLHVATTSGPEITVFASHRGVDSPFLYVRFMTLTALLALVSLSVALALSAVAGSGRSAILLGVAGLLLVVVGTDVALFSALDAGTSEGGLRTLLALSPTSAYRGLVFETVLYVAFEGRSGFVAPILAAVSLVGWIVLPLVGATAAIEYR